MRLRKKFYLISSLYELDILEKKGNLRYTTGYFTSLASYTGKRSSAHYLHPFLLNAVLQTTKIE